MVYGNYNYDGMGWDAPRIKISHASIFDKAYRYDLSTNHNTITYCQYDTDIMPYNTFQEALFDVETRFLNNLPPSELSQV